jgi:hypothetical protein
MNDQEWPPEGLDLEQLRAAGRAVARSIKPVLEVEQGSGGLRQIGSAFILRFGSEGALVTAEHTVSGPEYKVVALMEGTGTKWPRSYFAIDGRQDDIPTADVAYAFGKISHDAEGLMTGLGPDDIALGLEYDEGASFMSIGYPASRAKVRNADASIQNQLFFVSGHRVGDTIYQKLGLDSRVHIAVRYEPKAVRNMDGEWQRGAEPRGMSGGLLLAPMTRLVGSTSHTLLLVAGVLTRYYPAPDCVLVATRIDCVLDAVAPSRPDAERTHRAVRKH